MTDHDDADGAWWVRRPSAGAEPPATEPFGAGQGATGQPGPAAAPAPAWLPARTTLATGRAAQPISPAPAVLPSPTGARPRRSAGRRWARALSWTALVTAAVVLLSSLGGYLYLNRFVSGIRRLGSALPTQGQEALQGSMNVLLVGSDSRAGLGRNQQAALHVGSAGYGQHTDTMILVHISGRDHGHATLISMPRDTLVLIPPYTDSRGHHHLAHHAKMNEAYTDGGALLATQVVEQMTHLRIDHYVEVNFLGFVSMVNAVHGVDLCVPRALHDTDSGLDLPAGTSHLDGVQALKYVRARHVYANQDLGRIQAQQRFIAAMVRRVESLGVLANPFELKHLSDAVSHSLVTDRNLSTQNLLDLALALRNVKPEHVTFATVPLANPNASYPGVGSVVLWDSAAADDLFTRVNNDELVADSRTATARVPRSAVVVQVLNGGGVAGLGSKVRRQLVADGFTSAGPAHSTDPAPTTTIRYSGDSGAAHALLAADPTATLQQVPGLGTTVQFVIGRDFTALTPLPATPASGSTTGSSGTPAVPTRNAAAPACA